MKLKLFCLSIFVLLFTSETKAQFIRAALSLKCTFDTDFSFDYNPNTQVKGGLKEEAMKFVVQNVGKEFLVTNAGKVTKYEVQNIAVESLDKKTKKVKSISLHFDEDNFPKIVHISPNGSSGSKISYYYKNGKVKIYGKILSQEEMDEFEENIKRLSAYAQYIRTGNNGGEDDYEKICTMCRGTGICINCHGKKIVDDMFEQGKCSECSGTGHCATCNGKGYFSN